ncbi:MAG: hypothetical protein LBQ66_09045 [Planctomycetaceae bacterium]|jgi:hypothetical protein|nr:hypothetical protein [Planctomycetaceae bacterium]
MSNIFDISTQQKRERLLILLAGVVLVCVVVPFCYNFFNTAITKLRQQRATLEESIKKLENEVKDEKQIIERLAILSSQSLPAGELAKSQYQNWLADTANIAGLRERKIDQGTAVPLKGLYTKYTFRLTCRGTLGQITEFLRRFHRTNYLHLIRKISPEPAKNSPLMSVTITIEAVSLAKAQAGKTLPVIDKEKLRITEEETKVLKEITERNLFVAYTPPRPPAPPRVDSRPPRPPQFYQAPYCYVTAIVEVDGHLQVWIDHRAAGQKYKLYEGDSFKLENVDCYIDKIEFDKIHVEADKQKFTIKLGKSFAEYE